MKKLPAIAFEDLEKVMGEVTRDLKPLFSEEISAEEREALNTFVATLSVISLNIFDYLPPEQQDEILTNCGTWFDIGVLFGKAPQLLVKILNRANPQLEKVEVPDWFTKRIAGGLTSEGEG